MNSVLTPRAVDGRALGHTALPAFRIDDDVPMPPARAGKRKGMTSTLRALEVGQSFVAPPHPRGMKHAQINAGRAAAAIHGRKFATRFVEENGERVVRVWRTA